jgi:hypothetical protein
VDPVQEKGAPVIQIQLVSSEKEQSRWDENEALHDSQEAGALWAPQAPSAREPPLQERIPLRETLLGGRLARNQDQVFGGRTSNGDVMVRFCVLMECARAAQETAQGGSNHTKVAARVRSSYVPADRLITLKSWRYGTHFPFSVRLVSRV